MFWPAWWRKPATPAASVAARALNQVRVINHRNRVIDVANEMRARQGKLTMIPRRMR